MRSLLALVALAATATAQTSADAAAPTGGAVTQLITPQSAPPQQCSETANGQFQITIQNITNSGSSSKFRRDLIARQQKATTALECTLQGGVLKDAKGRTGYIASNYQFQFDGPPQAGAIYTGGFSLCKNGSLALGGSAVFWQCLSGDFFNLYDRDWAAHCIPCYFEAINGGTPVMSAAPVYGTATAAPAVPASSSAASSNSTASNATATSSSAYSSNTGSGSSGSGSSNSNSGSKPASASASGTPSEAIQFLPSIFTLAVAICLGLFA